jgi:NAD(P)-dependent dehydrogenase (short-subunit alcohol dehydrogenase family)
MVLGLLRAGAQVVLACTGKSKPLDVTLELAVGVAPRERAFTVFGDLRDADACARMAAEARAAFGAIDVLVNNAAVPMNGAGPPFWKIAPEDWSRVSHTNCDSVFFMSRSVAPSMIERGSGKIINVSTSDRTMVRPGFSPYGPSKAFVEACTRLWAGELSGTGVSMNVLSPGGVVDTAADVTGVAATGKSFLAADVMVPPLLWLCSSLSDGISGQRFLANLWNPDLPLSERIETARQSGAEVPRIM